MERFREGTGTSVVVAIGSAAIFTVLAVVLAVLFWIAFSIYAIVEIVGDGRPSAVAILLIVVGLVGGLTALAGIAIWFVGRRLAPAKRRPD
ncbi:MAG TPA: hypothetical protein VE800_09575 [Actinomycetota bacterium]|nr:hypothetical protein [Actinomycetota bacterium]